MNRLLIDTNILVYLLTDMLDDDTDALVRDYETQVYVSSVSVMEFINLIQSGRIHIRKSAQFEVFDFIENSLGYHILYTNQEHLKHQYSLPVVEGHNDPNDRLIIAQAICEGLELVSSDNMFRHDCKYGLRFIKANKNF